MKWPNFQLINLLKPAPYIEPLQDPDQIDKQYHYWRIRMCYSLFLGYVVYYFTRKNFAAIMPLMGADLGLNKTQLGILLSVFSLSYGISKFMAGIISDRSNPRYFMAIGLMATGILNILFGLSSSFPLLVFFWLLNGFFQAWGSPSCVKLLTYWFHPAKRGILYSICSTSNNVGSALIAILAPFIALQFGWRYALFMPAILSLVMGCILINRLRDVPQSLGLPPADHSPLETAHSLLSVKEILFKQILNNQYIWMFSLSYFFISIIQTTINDWSPFYLLEVRHFPNILTAGQGIVCFETGGLLGVFAAGWGSDRLFKGNRVQMMIACAIGLIFAISALAYSPASFPQLDLFYLGCIGFFVFGPHMLIGLAASEFVDKRATAASYGFVGFLGYIGAAFAGYPVGKIIDLWNWNGFFTCMMTSSVMILIILLPLWSLKNQSNHHKHPNAKNGTAAVKLSILSSNPP